MTRPLPQLPAPGGRWTPSRKVALLEHLRAQPTAAPDLMARYDLSPEELAGWATRLARLGERGLKVTQIQRVR